MAILFSECIASAAGGGGGGDFLAGVGGHIFRQDSDRMGFEDFSSPASYHSLNKISFLQLHIFWAASIAFTYSLVYMFLIVLCRPPRTVS